MLTYACLGIGLFFTIYVCHCYYKFKTDAAMLQSMLLDYLRKKIKYLPKSDIEDIDKNLDEILRKNIQGTAEWITHIEGEPSTACLKLNNRQVLLFDKEKIKQDIIRFFGWSCPYAIMDAYVTGLFAHERCHRIQFQKGYNLSYDGTQEVIDKDKYRKIPLEIAAYYVQYKTSLSVLSKYL